MTDHDLASGPPASTGAATPAGAWVSSPGEHVVPNDYDWGVSAMAPADTGLHYRMLGSRRSGGAVIGFGLAVVGLCATLTGLLASEGLVIALVGGVVSATAAVAAAPPRAGRGLALIGLFTAVIAMALAVLAMTRLFSWPNSGVNEVGQWHAWLVTHLSWLRRWA